LPGLFFRMTESIINALVHLFAIIESAKEDLGSVDSGELVVKPYLNKELNNETLTTEYIKLFHDYLNFYRNQATFVSQNEVNIDSTSILQIAKICNQLNKELRISERMIVFLRLFELIVVDKKLSDKEEEFASLVALNFNLNQDDLKNLKTFILYPESEDIDKERLLVIDNKQTEWPEDMAWVMRKKKKIDPVKHIYIENLFGNIKVLHLSSVNLYLFQYEGPLNLYQEGSKITAGKFYLLKPGSIIKGPNIHSIYESDITRNFIQDSIRTRVVLSGEDVEYKFKNSSNGIKPFTFYENSGELVGIMGGSGTGKSTLMNILNGKIKPHKGRIHVNGFSLEQTTMEGVIGYVPQDDLLFEELTVYQNLYFNAKICFSDFSEDLIEKTIQSVLEDLDLEDIKDLKVGDPLNKMISGGQRKRLNIALELMREPSILYVDEPTSGLSSMDSEKMMRLLKDLAQKGKLVICIIHQPSSDIFKLFDKLWILDKGGYPVYNGNPIDAVVYFKTLNTHVNAAESECPRCGNVIPDQILQIIETKEINDLGRRTKKRRVSPSMWYTKYKSNILPNVKRIKFESVLPPTNFRIPSSFDQFKIFSKRNFLSKISNKQYVLINLFEAPLLAFILGYFSKFSPEGVYSFANNINLPVYLFMSIVVALFMGLTISAQEIYKDRKITERESFLNLSRLSYINSKIVYLFVISAIQTLSFVLIGNYILEIEGMTHYYWLVLFSASCFANMVGLNISSAFNSVINIYILIPFILVPQLLLGGAMIKFDELHHSLSNQKNVPVVGDLMASRWAYEAIAVAQYRYNDYDKHFFEVNQEISENSFLRSFFINEIKSINDALLSGSLDDTRFEANLKILNNELNNLNLRHGYTPFRSIEALSRTYNESIGKSIDNYLGDAKEYFNRRYVDSLNDRDSIYTSLIKKLGKEEFLMLEKDNHNEFLEDLLMNKTNFKAIYKSKNELIQKKDPIFMIPHSNVGRAHFYAPYKVLGKHLVPTFVFNIVFIWIMSFVMYIFLLDNSLKKIIEFFQVKTKNEKKRKSRWNKFINKIFSLRFHTIISRAININRRKV